MVAKYSLNALRVVEDIKKSVREGKKVSISGSMRKIGYSKHSAHSMKVKKTKTYQENMPKIIDGLQTEIEEVKRAMRNKNKDHEEYKVLVYALDNLTKNFQLLSGGATERQVFVVPSEIMERNALEATDTETKKLENGSS